MNEQTLRKYRELRGLGHPASSALSWAKYWQAQRDVRARFGEWTFESGRGDTFAWAELDDLPEGSFRVRLSIGDDEAVDWGDIEPTEAEREHSSAFWVQVTVFDDDNAEVHQDSIGGVDVIDLPGYLQRDWEDAAAFAWIEYLGGEAERIARSEAAEAAFWAARDIITIG
jgi:hypothetical protein